MAQNGLKMGVSGALPKHSGTCQQIPRRGAADGILLRPLCRQVPNLAQRGLKAPFGAKFGMHLGVLAVFLGPLHDHVRPQAPALRVCRFGADGSGQVLLNMHMGDFFGRLGPEKKYFSTFFWFRPLGDPFWDPLLDPFLTPF